MYSRRPVVTLPNLTPSATLDSLIEKDESGGEKTNKSRFPRRHHKDQDELDAHVEHVLKRRAKIRRALRGLWQFIKTRKFRISSDGKRTITVFSTAAGIVTAIYGFAVGEFLDPQSSRAMSYQLRYISLLGRRDCALFGEMDQPSQ